MTTQQPEVLAKQWYVLKAAKKFGPFGFRDMIEMTQNMQVFEFDYVWTQGMKAWTPLAEIPEFSKENLKKFFKEEESKGTFYKRAHPRVDIKIPILAHNNDQIWRGHSIQLSEGGALLTMANPLLLPGQAIHVSFKKRNPTDLSFNIVVEVLGKRYTKERIQHDTEVTYAVKFIRKEKPAEEQLKKWIDSRLLLK